MRIIPSSIETFYYDIYIKGVPKLTQDLASLKKNSLIEEKFYRIIIQIKIVVYSKYKMSFNKF